VPKRKDAAVKFRQNVAIDRKRALRKRSRNGENYVWRVASIRDSRLKRRAPVTLGGSESRKGEVWEERRGRTQKRKGATPEEPYVEEPARSSRVGETREDFEQETSPGQRKTAHVHWGGGRSELHDRGALYILGRGQEERTRIRGKRKLKKRGKKSCRFSRKKEIPCPGQGEGRKGMNSSLKKREYGKNPGKKKRRSLISPGPARPSLSLPRRSPDRYELLRVSDKRDRQRGNIRKKGPLNKENGAISVERTPAGGRDSHKKEERLEPIKKVRLGNVRGTPFTNLGRWGEGGNRERRGETRQENMEGRKKSSPQIDEPGLHSLSRETQHYPAGGAEGDQKRVLW